jgi:predicted TIM-barrel fold metal-dependent hydrolase
MGKRLAGGYDAWWRATEALLVGLPPADKAAILGGNARRLYRLNRETP